MIKESLLETQSLYHKNANPNQFNQYPFDNFAQYISKHSARQAGCFSSVDLCAYAPPTPINNPRATHTHHHLLPLMSHGGNMDSVSVAPSASIGLTPGTSTVHGPPTLFSAEKDSVFTPPTNATHGTPSLFTRTAGKHEQYLKLNQQTPSDISAIGNPISK